MSKGFTDDEREHYRNLVAMFIGNNKEEKVRLDALARTQLASVKTTLPEADKETVCTFLISMAFLMTKVLATPVGSIAEMAHAIFENNITAAAHHMGAYDFDNPEDLPLFEPGHSHEDVSPVIAKTIDDIIARQYL